MTESGRSCGAGPDIGDDDRSEVCNGSGWTAAILRPATYRWAMWSSYNQWNGWMMGNRSELFGGRHPSQWTDGNAMAYQVSSNSDYLRTIYTRRGPTIGTLKNAMVYANEWYSYSSTNGRTVSVLFRIRNNTGGSITWKPYWYFSSYGGWSERASVSINGSNVWHSGGSNYGGNNGHTNHNISIPGNRTSTVIFVSTSSPQGGGTRGCQLGFYNNSLVLPNGLQYVDDLDTKPNGWGN